jgi:serine/threonine-protein kinase HipA
MKRCHSCLKIIDKEKGFCDTCKAYFGDNAVIDISLRQLMSKLYTQTRKNSMQGMQDKAFLKLENNQWSEVDWGNATHLLKLMPKRGNIYAYKNLKSIAANEHISMQIAQQIFDIPTAKNACIYLENDKNLVYITHLFNENQLIQGQEDLVQLSKLQPQDKYSFTYQKMFQTIYQYSTNIEQDREVFFKMIVLNVFLRNGDAHARNFSMLTTESGVNLAPLYDVLNTQIHFNDDDNLACSLFDSKVIKKYNDINSNKMIDFAVIIGLETNKAVEILNKLCHQVDKTEELINSSFLMQNASMQYKKYFRSSVRALCVQSKKRN